MHEENRRKNDRVGTHPRVPIRTGNFLRTTRCGQAFTMVELGIAILIFTVLAGVATLAVARAQLSSAKDRFARSAEAEIDTMLAIVATGPFDNLVDGNFLRPEPCTEAIHLSCPEIHGRTVTVTWNVEAVADPTGTSTENAAGVLLTASTELPFGDELSRQRFVANANGGRAGSTLVNVNLTGETYTGPVYLMTAAEAVAGSALADTMRAVIRATVTDCTQAAPCRLALRPDGTALEEDVSLDHASVTGDGIVLDEGTVSETGAVIDSVRELHVLLLAENEDGRRDWARDPGSVCLYLSIPTSTGTIEEPACNTENPDRVIWRGYHPDRGGRPNVVVALPAETDMTVLTDPATDVCQADGQQGWTSGTWTTAAVCTGWTWGTFAELRDDITGTGTGTGTTVRLDTTDTAAWYTAVWIAATGNGAPAAGRSDDDLWAKPRDVPACSATTTCTAPTGNPESACPTGHCNSTRPSAPILLEPRRGTYKVPAVTVAGGELTTFTVTVADTENDDPTITVTSTVSGLSIDGEPILTGDVLGTAAETPGSVELDFEPASGFTSDTLVLTLADSGTTRDVEILLTSAPGAALQVHAPPVRVAQDGTATLRILVVDDLGEGATSAPGGHTAPTGVVIGTPAMSIPGVYTALISATDAATGTATYTLTAGAGEDTTNVTVTGTPGTVTASDASYQQNETGQLTATVADVAGAPLAGAHVWFALTSGTSGTTPLGAVTTQRGCITDVAGTCDVDLTVETNAVPGTFTITARSGSTVDTAILTITESIARVVSEGIELEQGDSGAVTFTAYNGRSEPAAGIPFTASVTAPGATVTPSGTTNQDGEATVTVETGTNTPIGELVVTIGDGANEHQIRVEVVSTVTSVDLPGTTRVAQYGYASATVTARNAQGNPVPYALLELSPDTGVSAPETVVTAADGTARISFAIAGDATVGDHTIGISYTGIAIGDLELDVIEGIASLTTMATLEAGTTQPVRVTITDNDGELIGGRDLTLTAKDTRLVVVTATVRSNLLGYADFVITVGNVPAGSYQFTVTVDGRTIPLTLKVKP
jgi:type II secretory pathway pseudopilin PulG